MSKKNFQFNLDYRSQLGTTFPHSTSLFYPLKPQLYHIPTKPTLTHLCNLHTSQHDIISKYGAVKSFYFIIFVKWVIILYIIGPISQVLYLFTVIPNAAFSKSGFKAG